MTPTYEKLIHFLRQTDEQAADQTLGLALLAEPQDSLQALVSALLLRSSDDALAYVVRVFHKLSPPLQQSLLEVGPGISGALRLASRDTDWQVRQNVIHIIGLGNYPRLAYLLGYLLLDDVPAIRTKAAMTYKVLALKLLSRLQSSNDSKEPANRTDGSSEETQNFWVSLDSCLETFPHHLRTEIIEAAMYFGPLLPENIWNRFTGDRSRIGRVSVEILKRDSNPLFAGFAFRALTDAELGKNMVKIIAAGCNSDFFRKWLTFAWYRFDANVRKNLTRINKDFRWLAASPQPLLETPPELQIRFVDILLLTSIPASQKLETLSTLMVACDSMVQEHVVASLIDSDLPEFDKLLTRLISLESSMPISAQAARMARQYLQHVQQPAASNEAPAEPVKIEPGIEQYFDQFWLAFAHLDISASRSAIERLQRLDDHFSDHVREKIASADPKERAKAISLVRRGNLTAKFAKEIYKLCGDIDTVTRSSAVSALADIPGPETEHKIIDALDDEDARVQANAIEALEAVNPPYMMEILESKLVNPNNRIRANAIKAILKPQYILALNALSSMLDHPDPTFRRSALWAVLKTTPLNLGAKVNKLAKTDPDPEVRSIATQAMGAMLTSWKESKKAEPDGSKVGAQS